MSSEKLFGWILRCLTKVNGILSHADQTLFGLKETQSRPWMSYLSFGRTSGVKTFRT